MTEWLNHHIVWAHWLTAIGTVGAVITSVAFALLLNRDRVKVDFFFSPKYSNNDATVEITDMDVVIQAINLSHHPRLIDSIAIREYRYPFYRIDYGHFQGLRLPKTSGGDHAHATLGPQDAHVEKIPARRFRPSKGLNLRDRLIAAGHPILGRIEARVTMLEGDVHTATASPKKLRALLSLRAKALRITEV